MQKAVKRIITIQGPPEKGELNPLLRLAVPGLGNKMLKFLKNKKEDKSKLIEKDIGFVEDAFEMCKNMIAFEDHSMGSFMATEDPRFLEEMNWMRELRTHYLNLIAKSDMGQDWCRSKHLCRVAMGLQELCARYLSLGDFESAKKCALDAREAYFRFLKLNGYKEEDTQKSKSSA